MVILQNPVGGKQVGGHWEGPIKMLYEDGKFKKPIKYGKELLFNQEIAAKEGTVFSMVREHNLMPKYHGTEVKSVRISESETREVQYMVLDDVTAGFVKPCTLDVKIGTQSWHAECSAQERARRIEADKHLTTGRYGFKFTGLRTKDPATGEDRDYPRNFSWECLDDEAIIGAFGKFLECCPRAKLAATLEFYCAKIGRVMEFMRVSGYAIVNSSLLMMYDADPASEREPELVMIDFSHATKLPEGQVDEGYIFGCSEMVRLFRVIMSRI